MGEDRAFFQDARGGAGGGISDEENLCWWMVHKKVCGFPENSFPALRVSDKEIKNNHVSVWVIKKYMVLLKIDTPSGVDLQVHPFVLTLSCYPYIMRHSSAKVPCPEKLTYL